MNDAMLLLATWLGATLGFSFLAIAQEKHRLLLPVRYRDTSTFGMKLAGWALLTAAIAPAICRDGIAFGLVLWCMMLTISALTVVGCIYGSRKVDG